NSEPQKGRPTSQRDVGKLTSRPSISGARENAQTRRHWRRHSGSAPRHHTDLHGNSKIPVLTIEADPGRPYRRPWPAYIFHADDGEISEPESIFITTSNR